MRLINTSTLCFEECENPDPETLRYAILSHRWQEEEVLFKDMEQGTASRKKGYQKVLKLCELAKEDGIQYAWIDTCCIDKSSSAELSEAINSMYQWYENSSVCYVYLSDVNATHAFVGMENYWNIQRRDDFYEYESCPLPNFDRDFLEEFYDSEWFSRGWTLQELIAPDCMQFFNSSWQRLGNKKALGAAISFKTSVPTQLLWHRTSPCHYTVAERMSWAARRDTSYVEDVAYCLMGIFDVNMPLLYGEGRKAFFRLQEEIIKMSEDDSILLFQAMPMEVLAGHPEQFEYHLPAQENESKWMAKPFQQSFRAANLISYFEKPEVFSMSNAGLTFDRPLFHWCRDLYVARLRTASFSSHDRLIAYIFLRFSRATGRFYRCTFHCESVKWLHDRGPLSEADSNKTFRSRTLITDKHQGISRSIQLIADCDHGTRWVRDKSVLLSMMSRPPVEITHVTQASQINFQTVMARFMFEPESQHVAVVAGKYEVQAILHVKRKGMSSCLYLGYDPDGVACLVRKDWHLETHTFAHALDCLRSNIADDLSHSVFAYDHFFDSMKCAKEGAPNANETLVMCPSQSLQESCSLETGIAGLTVTIDQDDRVCTYTFEDAEDGCQSDFVSDSKASFSPSAKRRHEVFSAVSRKNGQDICPTYEGSFFSLQTPKDGKRSPKKPKITSGFNQE